MLSPAQLLASLPEQERQAWLAALSTEQQASLRYNWPFWARPEQLAPDGDWRVWLALAGRGWGKTETGANWIRSRVAERKRTVALVAETQKDLEEVMIPRIMFITPESERPEVRFKPVRLRWPNESIGYGYVGSEPDQLRGPEFDTVWLDELAKYAKPTELWDMLEFTMRKVTVDGGPRIFVSTTPRPIPIIRSLMADKGTIVTRGTLMDNADNLDNAYVKRIQDKYEGTRLGRQEIMGEVLDDVPGALWTRDMLERCRVPVAPEMSRVVVAIDPSGTDGGEDGDEVGIVVVGRGVDGRGYVLADRSCRLSPDGWARRAVTAYHEFGGDRIVAERNFGGAMVSAVIRQADRSVAYKEVTASRGKAVRAEPVSALFEQGRVSIVGGMPELEDQLVLMTPGGYLGETSPDRLDAMVWALSEVMLTHQPPVRTESFAIPKQVSAFGRR